MDMPYNVTLNQQETHARTEINALTGAYKKQDNFLISKTVAVLQTKRNAIETGHKPASQLQKSRRTFFFPCTAASTTEDIVGLPSEQPFSF